MTIVYLHVSKLLHCRQSGHVEPAGVLALAQVVSLVLELSKRGPAQTMKLEHHLLLLLVGGYVDVGLLTNTNLVANRMNNSSGGQGLEGQVVIAKIGEPEALSY